MSPALPDPLSPPVTLRPEGVQTFFEREVLRADEVEYLRFHTARYAHLLAFIDRLSAEMIPRFAHRDLRILDIGPAFETALLRARFPCAEVNTLGLQRTDRAHPGLMGKLLAGGRHWTVDLNQAAEAAGWPSIPEHHLIVMAEVIEHLYTAPDLVLRAVRKFLCDDGCLILQTPNACALHKRLKMAVGRHPFGAIEEWREGVHFREYTISELVQVSMRAGYEPVRVEAANYFRRDTVLSDLYNAVGKLLPRSFRAGITMALRKPPPRRSASADG